MEGRSTTPSACQDMREQAGNQGFSSFPNSSKVNFEDLVQRHAEQIRAVLFAILGDHRVADEACFEVFARAYRTLATSREPRLDLIRLSVDRCRHARWPAYFARYATNQGPAVGQESTRDQALSLLRRLPWNQRIPLVLREIAELSTDQVAAVLGHSVEEVRSDLLNARRQLMKTVRGMNETKH